MVSYVSDKWSEGSFKPFVFCCLSYNNFVCRSLSFVFCRLSFIIYHLSSVVYNLSVVSRHCLVSFVSCFFTVCDCESVLLIVCLVSHFGHSFASSDMTKSNGFLFLWLTMDIWNLFICMIQTSLLLLMPFEQSI